MTRAESDACGEVLDCAVVERSILDESQSAADDRRRSEPRGAPGRNLRSAAPTGTIARRLGCRGGRVENDVRSLTAWRWAYGAAIDARAQYRDEEFAVEPSVAAESRPMQGGRGESRYSAHDTDTPCCAYDYGCSCTQNGWLGSAGVVSAGPTPTICTTTSSLLLEPSQCSPRAGWNM